MTTYRLTNDGGRDVTFNKGPLGPLAKELLKAAGIECSEVVA